MLKPENLTMRQKNFTKEIIEGAIEALIINSKFINEGNNGVIKEIDMRKIPRETLKEIKEVYPNFANTEYLAIKMLKIYNKGKAKQEFDAQQKAFNIISKSGREDLAKIPNPLIHEELTVKTPRAKAILEQDGIMDSHVEVILMDLIRGEDLAEYLYKEVIRLHPNLEAYKNQIDDMPIHDLQNYVSKELGFAKTGEHNGVEDRKIKEDRVNADNLKIMLNFLKRRQFQMDENIINKLEKTIKILNDNNFYHRDLHERNVMITKDDEGKITDVYIIDFGSAKEFSPETKESEIYTDGDKLLVRDETIINRYKQFSKTFEDNLRDESKKGIDDIMSEVKKIKESEDWKKLKEDLKNAKDLKEVVKIINIAVYKIAGGIENDYNVNIRCATIIELSKVNKDLATEYANNIINGKDTNIRLRNKLAKIINLL